MLFSFVEWVGAELTNRRVGARLVAGREQAGRVIPTENAIIVDRARGIDGDGYQRPRAPGEKTLSSGGRAKLVYERGIVIDVGFLARSTRPGATDEDHLVAVDNLVDAFLCAADSGTRQHMGRFEPIGGGYPLPDAQTDDSIFAGWKEIGARYVLRARAWRGVLDVPQVLGTVVHVATDVIDNYGTGSSEIVTVS